MLGKLFETFGVAFITLVGLIAFLLSVVFIFSGLVSRGNSAIYMLGLSWFCAWMIATHFPRTEE